MARIHVSERWRMIRSTWLATISLIAGLCSVGQLRSACQLTVYMLTDLAALIGMSPALNRSVRTNREKYQEDKIVLLEVTADFCFMVQMASEIPADDELTRGFCALVEDKKTPLWLVFSAQNFLDIHHIFRQDFGKAFAVLQKTERHAKETIEQNLLFHQSLRLPNWLPHNDLGLKRPTNSIDGR